LTIASLWEIGGWSYFGVRQPLPRNRWCEVAFDIFKIVLIEYLELTLFSDNRTYKMINRPWSASQCAFFFVASHDTQCCQLVLTIGRPVLLLASSTNFVQNLGGVMILAQLSGIRSLILKVFEDRKRTFNIRAQQRIPTLYTTFFGGQCLKTFVDDNSSALLSSLIGRATSTLSCIWQVHLPDDERDVNRRAAERILEYFLNHVFSPNQSKLQRTCIDLICETFTIMGYTLICRQKKRAISSDPFFSRRRTSTRQTCDTIQ